jgi:predicted kinase
LVLEAVLVVFSGLPGTGKSTLARAIVGKLDAIWLRVDVVEAALIKAGLNQSFKTGLAAYIADRDIASDHLSLGRSVVIDAVNGLDVARDDWRSLAYETGADLTFVEVTCSDKLEHRRRVESREPPTPPLPKPTWEEVLSREYAPWAGPILKIDTREPLDTCVTRILNHLRVST